MSNAVFPTLPGLAFGIERRPSFQTLIARSVSGREVRGTYQNYPLYEYTLPFEYLRDLASTPDYDTLVGFYLARLGSGDSFLFSDPVDASGVDMGFGVGNAVATQFQLTRAFGAGGFTLAEPIQNVNVLTNIKVAGVTKVSGTDYTVSATGLVTFTTAPASSAALTWTGSYYYRCRFSDDMLDTRSLFANFWEAKSVAFVGAPGNRV